MKNHSILTTQFPRLPFSRYSMGGIASELKIVSGLPDPTPNRNFKLRPSLGHLSWQETKLDSFMIVPDFLPAIQVEGKNVKCSATYQEFAVDHPMLIAAENPAIVQINLKLKGSDGQILELNDLVGKAASGRFSDLVPPQDQSLVFKFYWDLLIQPEVSTIEFMMNIMVEEPESRIGSNPEMADSMVASLRREYVAREITTGYRRYVSHLLTLLSVAAHKQKAENGRSVPLSLADVGNSAHVVNASESKSNSDLHSTKEDAWRLLCTFQTIEKAAKRVNCGLRRNGPDDADYVLGLQDFVSSLTNSKVSNNGISTAQGILNELFSSRAIRKEISLRKVFEYYIFEAISCTPA